ncbi:hypothetical protein RhiXN_05276 [Rhizoctonia solani]|uniref:Uncharacterized protein n=1 Tax=Rhizoctonia solani TaxID=456999 RepID=A0A8H8ST71_9AGAM|nr:uncharacterized protein RhiXN_05276 [Rhizoctonia solani]QRW17274.1 hypothetical protein RhiXN_05276 [Rhizoctonia solani]
MEILQCVAKDNRRSILADPILVEYNPVFGSSDRPGLLQFSSLHIDRPTSLQPTKLPSFSLHVIPSLRHHCQFSSTVALQRRKGLLLYSVPCWQLPGRFPPLPIACLPCSEAPATDPTAYSASLVPTAATASYSEINSHSLVIDPTATSDSKAKSAAPTFGATETGSVDDGSIDQSTADKLFSPNGGLFAVGIVIIGLAGTSIPSHPPPPCFHLTNDQKNKLKLPNPVLTFLTCGIVTIRCILRNRRQSRTRSRLQTLTEKNVARRKISSDRVSEFWSAGANEPARRWTQWGDGLPGRASDLSNDGQRPPARPARRGEAEADLRAPGRVHFTASVAMSDYTGLSVDVQPHGSARSSGANMDTDMANPVSTNSAAVLPNPVVAGPTNRHMSTATKFTTYTLDQDPFAASPIMPVPNTANPLLPPAHAMTFPPYSPSTPHTPGDPFAGSPQFAADFSSSPSNMATLGSSPSGMLSRHSSLGSSNMLGLASSPSNTPYISADMTPPLGTPTSGVMYKSGVDSLISDPFAYDTAPGCDMDQRQLGSRFAPNTTHRKNLARHPNEPTFFVLPDTTQPTIRFSPRPDVPSPNASDTTATILVGPDPPQQPLAFLQSDVSQALNNLRRRMSDSTMATRHSQQTDCQYRPTLGAIPDRDERSSAFFMYNSPASPRRSLPFVPRVRVSASTEPEMHQMQPTRIAASAASQDDDSVYSSPASMIDGYHQSPRRLSELRSGSGTHPGSSLGPVLGLGLSVDGSGSNGSPAQSNSVRTSVLSFYAKDSHA